MSENTMQKLNDFLKAGWFIELYASEYSIVSMACQLDDGGNQINDEVFEGLDFESSVLGLISKCESTSE